MSNTQTLIMIGFCVGTAAISGLVSWLVTASYYRRKFRKRLPANAAVNAAIATIMLQSTQVTPSNLQPKRLPKQSGAKSKKN